MRLTCFQDFHPRSWLVLAVQLPPQGAGNQRLLLGAPGVVLQVALQTLPSATLLTKDVRRGVVQALMKSTQTESLSLPPLPVLGNPGRKMKLV